MSLIGFPHSEISGSKLFIQLPEAYRRYHVLLRLLMPRHPSAALNSLITRSFVAITSPTSLYFSVKIYSLKRSVLFVNFFTLNSFSFLRFLIFFFMTVEISIRNGAVTWT